MDDLGAEQLCKLSSTCNNFDQNLNVGNESAITNSSLASATLTEDRFSSNNCGTINSFDNKAENFVNKASDSSDIHQQSSRSNLTTTTTTTSAEMMMTRREYNLPHSIQLQSTMNNEDYEQEKTDVTPENVKKIDDVILSADTHYKKSPLSSSSSPSSPGNSSQLNIGGSSSSIKNNDYNDKDNNSIELKIIEDESPTKQNLAFTIQFSEGGESSSAAAKYKTMVERFQNRHKRGTSMSKLDDSSQSNFSTPVTPIASRTSRIRHSSAAPTVTTRTIRNGTQSLDVSEGSETGKVKLRIRDKSTSRVRDASKRHSWSPRSSTHEPLEHHMAKSKEKSIKNIDTRKFEKINNFSKKSNEIASNDNAHKKSFSPRSGGSVQLTANRVEFNCPEPPLGDFSKQPNAEENDCESVSDDGTYTIDGDNYTEEQKEQMNIDKNIAAYNADLNIRDTKILSSQLRPNDLPLQHVILENQQKSKQSNVLEVNYYHDSTSLKPKISYLEKIKSRVRNISIKSPIEKKIKSPTDTGMFTSVTTSGVLSIKPVLDSHPKITNRRSSLTKSQVDNSEYVSDKTAVGITGHLPFTDHQKAEYKLNLFNTNTSTCGSVIVNQTDSEILLNEGRYDYQDTVTGITPDSPTIKSPYSNKPAASDAGLKTAQSKNDWIQEWARNARARNQSITGNAIANEIKHEIMSRSCNFDTPTQCEQKIDDNQMIMSSSAIYRNNKQSIVDRIKSFGGDCEYSSDPNVSTTAATFNRIVNDGRPPMSPSKIPSPIHSISRARSTSRTRGSLQDLSPLKSGGCTPDTDVYLQKTAAAISNLTHSFSKKTNTAIKSPPSLSTGDNSPQEYNSPTHINHQNHYHHHSSSYCDGQQPSSHHNVHKRNLSLDYRNNLMSNSLNTETLATILDKRNHPQSNRYRQNSYDSTLFDSPRLFQRKTYIDQTAAGALQQTSSIKQQSPIRRSSSFSTKTFSPSKQYPLEQNYQQFAIVNRRQTESTINNPIQKSASSNSFRKMYSDYDDNIAYYINDEDDLVDEYCGIGSTGATAGDGSSDDFDSDHYTTSLPQSGSTEPPTEPLTNTRYNKALLMRIEKSKQKVAANTRQTKPFSAIAGVIACPNTPEMPRRAVQSAKTQRSAVRQSVPRDSSLSRLKSQIPNSLASAKKQLLQSAATPAVTTPNLSGARKVQSKYLDISKYKSAQNTNFLRKNETKSTLTTRPISSSTSVSASEMMKRSPTSATVNLNRSDPSRTSNRSNKSSAVGRPNSSNTKREPAASKQKEVELAMWKRRATYDPMKSAAEDRKRKEEAKRLASSKSVESSVVTRSQSFHCGVTLTSIGTPKIRHRASELRLIKDGSSDNTSNDDINYNRWTLTSTESSDDDYGDSGGSIKINDYENAEEQEENEFGEFDE